MECRWLGEVWWSENRLDDSGRKYEFYLMMVDEMGG